MISLYKPSMGSECNQETLCTPCNLVNGEFVHFVLLQIPVSATECWNVRQAWKTHQMSLSQNSGKQPKKMKAWVLAKADFFFYVQFFGTPT